MKGKKYVFNKILKKMVEWRPPEELPRGPAVVENSRKMGAKNFNRLGSSRKS